MVAPISYSPARLRNSSGGVIIEFLITIPFLFILFSGLLELGRLHSQLTWVTNMAYEIAMAGTGWPQGPNAITDMQGRNTQLGQLYAYHKLSAPPPWQDPVYTTSGPMANTFQVTVNANVPPLMQLFSGNFQTTLTAPMLATNTWNAGNMNQFGNPGCLYHCDGTLISTGGCCTSSACTDPSC